MSATDEMRRLLDERGVEYTTDDKQVVRYTDWGQWFFAEPLDAEPNTLGAQCELVCMPVTPEQAIEATLGRGTCRDVGRYAFVCSVCGWASDEPHHVLGGFWPKYCPECGRAVVE